jgi:hypothetical protein
MSTQYRLVQSGKTASGGCSAGQGSSEPVAPRIIIIIIVIKYNKAFSGDQPRHMEQQYKVSEAFSASIIRELRQSCLNNYLSVLKKTYVETFTVILL